MTTNESMDETLAQLQHWYASQCDGDWEHDFGVRIETLDNPGWALKINLAGTTLEGRTFEPISRGVESALATSAEWHAISVNGAVFEGFGDPSKLIFLIRSFLDWSEAAERPRS